MWRVWAHPAFPPLPNGSATPPTPETHNTLLAAPGSLLTQTCAERLTWAWTLPEEGPPYGEHPQAVCGRPCLTCAACPSGVHPAESFSDSSLPPSVTCGLPTHRSYVPLSLCVAPWGDEQKGGRNLRKVTISKGPLLQSNPQGGLGKKTKSACCK